MLIHLMLQLLVSFAQNVCVIVHQRNLFLSIAFRYIDNRLWFLRKSQDQWYLGDILFLGSERDFITKMFEPPNMVPLDAGSIQGVEIIRSQIRIRLLRAQEVINDD